VYIVYIRDCYYFIMCVQVKKVGEDVEVKIDVQKGALGFKTY
jgi:hypothetical protein